MAKIVKKKDGLRPECKICKSKRDKEYKIRNKEKIKKIQKDYYQNNSEKIKERSKMWNQNNFLRAKETKRKWHVNNKGKVDELRAKHLEENKEFYKVYQREYQKRRYQEDTNYRIKCCMNKRLRYYIKDKNHPTLNYLGIPMEEFREWIEFQFEKDMSWKNMGKYGWSFDHVIPCDSFDLSKEEQIFECYNWKNLRPCWCSENSSKGSKIIKKIISLQEKKVSKFIKQRYCY